MERTIDSLQNETIQGKKEIIALLKRKIELLTKPS